MVSEKLKIAVKRTFINSFYETDSKLSNYLNNNDYECTKTITLQNKIMYIVYKIKK